ncbi:MAG: PKD domain-containing protein, partial [Candidatus Bathyarchaeia archaeon]
MKVSLPDGTYMGSDVDPWLNECWLLNLTGFSQTFTVRVNNTSAAKRSYDTRLAIALNDAGYNNLQSLIVNGTSIPKSAFEFDKPQPYDLWDWPSGDVYPTWFEDTYVNIGTIYRKSYKSVVVSVTFSSVTGIRMHFDAYGSKVLGAPCYSGYITHNGISEDSTVLFSSGQPANQPPTADFFYTPSYPISYESVTFNASGSYDPDGCIANYSWVFGDGAPIVVESDAIAYHTYSSYGNHTVMLTVTDNDGLTADSTSPISVR